MNEWGRLEGGAVRPSLWLGVGPAFSYSSSTRDLSTDKDRLLIADEVLGADEGEGLSDIHNQIQKPQYIGGGGKRGYGLKEEVEGVDKGRWEGNC